MASLDGHDLIQEIKKERKPRGMKTKPAAATPQPAKEDDELCQRSVPIPKKPESLDIWNLLYTENESKIWDNDKAEPIP